MCVCVCVCVCVYVCVSVFQLFSQTTEKIFKWDALLPPCCFFFNSFLKFPLVITHPFHWF